MEEEIPKLITKKNMGIFISNLIAKFISKEEKRILMLGLDAAGKTTIMFKLKLNEVVQSTPTIGFNCETVQFQNIKFTIWDIGGQHKIRSLWHHYFENSAALIYVIDSIDTTRILEAKNELNSVLSSEHLDGVPVLVFANKQDQAQMSVSQIAEKLELHSLKRRQWHIQGSCALTGDGLHDGLFWLAKNLKKN